MDQYVATAVMAALQDDPTLCDDVLDLTHIAQGICGVALYVDGRPSLVYIDTFFPCSPSSRLLVGAQRRGQAEAHVKEAWPAAVEKAIAKSYGSYQAISGSNGICLALAALCGTSPEYQDLRLLRGVGGVAGKAAQSPTDGAAHVAVTSLWKRVRGWRGVLLCGSRSVYGCEGVDMEGIVPGCTYHVLGVLQWGDERVLKLACALVAGGEWRGSPALARSAQVVQSERDRKAAERGASLECDNAFWIPYAKFMELFDVVVLAHRRNLGWGAERARQDLLELFGSKRACLVPGVRQRQQSLAERVNADRVAMQLIKQEAKELKRMSAAASKKKGASKAKKK